MLDITIPKSEYFDNIKNEFIATKEQSLQLEHSLVSIAKWEAKWNKPFLSSAQKTTEETYDYIRCMTLTQNVDSTVYKNIPSDLLDTIKNYIEKPMTATTFNDKNTANNKKEIITAELIYYWMISLNIPFECQKWHLNKLLTLIRVCNIKNTPPKKMTKQEIFNRNKMLNAERKRTLQTKG